MTVAARIAKDWRADGLISHDAIDPLTICAAQACKVQHGGTEYHPVRDTRSFAFARSERYRGLT